MPDLTEMAKELHGVIWTFDDWNLLTQEEKEEWLILAKHVKKMVLEARIKEGEIHLKLKYQQSSFDQIAELKAQLRSLSNV